MKLSVENIYVLSCKNIWISSESGSNTPGQAGASSFVAYCYQNLEKRRKHVDI